MLADHVYMNRALTIAKRGRGWTSPNPMVGCVIVRDGVVIAEGWHQRVGMPHAEAMACEQCPPEALQGSVVYVTLEPCAHYGRTAPCTDLFLTHRPSRIVIAMEDPNPHVKGGGIEILRSAGITVEVGLLEKEAARLNEIFIKYSKTGMPWVTAKCAMSLDGKIATHTGHSRWITGMTARLATHELRHAHDAILVGSRTVHYDRPRLTTRLMYKEGRNPVRIILDAEGILEGNRDAFQDTPDVPVWVAGKKNGDYPFADEVIDLPVNASGMDMPALMASLGARGVTSVLIEGGGETLASAFFSGVVDKLCFFVAPKIIGGRDAVTPVEGKGIDHMNEALHFTDLTAQTYGEDVCLEAYVTHETSGRQDAAGV